MYVQVCSVVLSLSLHKFELSQLKAEQKPSDKTTRNTAAKMVF